ncbi:MAG: ribosome recycling factor [Phycisphaeraceae bacterium]|nr:ribosome recycling factor [Phycisphaeraceae bacterium]
MTLDGIARECRSRMQKSVEYLEKELRGIRTGRASTALIEYIKVDYYGSPTDLRELAAVSVPESTKLLVKPFDPSAKGEIARAIESANLGLNPQIDSDSIRINVPPPSAQRRAQLVAQVRKLAEETRVAIRNERRDALKQIDTMVKNKDNHLSEDAGKHAKDEVESHTKHFTKQVDDLSARKSAEVEDIG